MDLFLIRGILRFLQYIELFPLRQVCNLWKDLIDDDIIPRWPSLEPFWQKNVYKLLKNFHIVKSPCGVEIDTYYLLEFGIKIKFFDYVENKKRVVDVYIVDFLDRHYFGKCFRFSLVKNHINTYYVEYDHVKKIAEIRVSSFTTYFNLNKINFLADKFKENPIFFPIRKHSTISRGKTWKIVNCFWVNFAVAPKEDYSQKSYLGIISLYEYWVCGKKVSRLIYPCKQYALTTEMPFHLEVQKIIHFHNSTKYWIIVALDNNSQMNHIHPQIFYSRFLLKIENEVFSLIKIPDFFREIKLYPLFNPNNNSILFYNKEFNLCQTIFVDELN